MNNLPRRLLRVLGDAAEALVLLLIFIAIGIMAAWALEGGGDHAGETPGTGTSSRG